VRKGGKTILHWNPLSLILIAAMTSAVPPSDAQGEGPLLSLFTKKIRTIRKKLEKIRQLEDTVTGGKAINQEQQAVLDSKELLVIQMDELEKLKPQLLSALKEEKDAWVPPPPPKAKKEPVAPPNTDEIDKLKAEKEAAVSATIQHYEEQMAEVNATEAKRLRSLIELTYFAQVRTIV
jgi:hypothetical protein